MRCSTRLQRARWDELIVESKLRPQEKIVLATLLVLEVRRLCRQLPGKRYVKA